MQKELKKARKYRKKKDYENAIEFYSRAIQVSPKSFVALYELSELYQKTGEIDKAIKLCLKLTDYYPNDSKPMFFLTLLYQSVGKLDLALEQINRAIKKALSIQATRFLFKKAELLANLDRNDEALDLLFQLLEPYHSLKPKKHKLTTINKAMERFKLEAFKFQLIQAIEEIIYESKDLQKVLQSSDREPALLKVVGALYSDMGNLQESKKYYEQYISIFETDIIALNNLGSIYIKLGEYDKAINVLEKALILDEKTIDMLNIGHIRHINVGVFNDNLSDFIYNSTLDEISDHSPTLSPTVLHLLGYAYFHLGKVKKSLKLAQRAVKIDPDYKEAWYTIALARNSLNFPLEAIKACEKALKIDPHYLDALQLKSSLEGT